MGINDFATILGIGVVGVGGYLFVTQVWPMVKRQLQDLTEGELEERMIPPMIVEDRIPDYVVEDRYPDVVVEDRYPDFYNVPYFPVITPPRCPSGKFWNGFECQRVSCGPCLKWDDGKCRPDCPNGWRWDDGRCKPRNCDDDEYFDGSRCRKYPGGSRNCPDGWHWDDGRCKPWCTSNEYWDGRRCRDRPNRDRDRDWDRDRNRRDNDWEPRPAPVPVPVPKPGGRDWKKKANKKRDSDREMRWNNGNSRDKWHADRDVEEKVKAAITDQKSTTPEANRVADIQEKALKNFIEIWEV